MEILDCQDQITWMLEFDTLWSNLSLTTIENCRNAKGKAAFHSDDLSWIPRNNVISEIRSAFKSRHHSLKCFHACRPVDMKSYFDHGIQGQSRSLIHSNLHKLFPEINFNQYPIKNRQLLERINNEQGKVYLDCEKNMLLEDFGHVLIRGGEMMAEVASCLCVEYSLDLDYDERILEAGIGTIFEIEFPMSNVPEYEYEMLHDSLISYWAETRFHGHSNELSDLAIALPGPVQSQYIRGHSHPHRILDPRSYEYADPITVCDFCEKKTQ